MRGVRAVEFCLYHELLLFTCYGEYGQESLGINVYHVQTRVEE